MVRATGERRQATKKENNKNIKREKKTNRAMYVSYFWLPLCANGGPYSFISILLLCSVLLSIKIARL